MLSILSITTPIYLLMLLGYIAVRSGLFARADMRVLGQYVIRFALPALLFRTLAQRQLAEIVNPHVLLAYTGGSLCSLGVGWWWARGKPASYRAIVGTGMALSNSGFVGAPVLLQWLGPPAGLAIALVMVAENLFILPIALALAERGTVGSGSFGSIVGRTLKPLARHPLIQSIVVGIAVSALGWTLPTPLQRSVDLLANASAGVALVVIGGTLVGVELRGLRKDIAAVVIGKLLLHPLAVALLAYGLMPEAGVLHTAVIALAAMPMLSIYPVLAQKHGNEGFAAAALLVTTVTSFFTLSGLIWLLAR